jgi:hypothetical protein
MDKHQHIKDARLIEDLKRQISDLKKGSSRGVHLERKEVVLTVLALCPALAGFFIDDWYPFLLFIALCWLSVLALCAANPGRKWARLSIALLATAVYGGVLCRAYVKRRIAAQEDAFRNLSLDMQTPYFGQYPIKVFFTVRNGGATPIIKHRNTCIVNAMRDTSNAGVLIPKGVVNPWSESQIGPGGDAMSDACSLDMFAFQNPFRCLDVTVKVEYTLETQPSVIKEKEWRYVAERTWGPHWFPYSTSNGPGNFCDGTEKY